MASVERLRPLLREHLTDPFPESIEKGEDYRSVDPVMIDADIVGWVTRIADTGPLPTDDRDRLEDARVRLSHSLPALPLDARPYYERLVEMAIALEARPSLPISRRVVLC